MNGGQLTNKIKFITRDLISDGAGGFLADDSGNIILETIARIEPIKATRTAENLQEGINPIYKVRVFKRNGFEPKSNMGVLWRDEVYSIITIEETLEAPREWILVVTKHGDEI